MPNSPTVLYVEDCEITVELFRRSFKRYNTGADIELEVAATVSDAIEIFTTQRHIAALIDWNLPDGEGLEVAGHIRLSNKTLPIIFMSAAFTEQHLRVAQQYHPRVCLVKEYNKPFIDNIIQHIFAVAG